MIIDFIRHGEPVGGSCYRGSAIDDILSEKGWEQMNSAVIGYAGWSRVVSSPLLRCQQFARQLAGQLEIPMQIEDDLREVGFGSWEGKTRLQLQADSLAEYEAFYRDPVNARPEGAESLQVFGKRVAMVYDKLVESYSDENLLVVAHAGVVRAACGYVLQAPPVSWYRLGIDNAGITRFKLNKGSSSMLFHNRPNMAGLG